MTEHVHEWAINIAFEHNYGAWGVCKNCMEVLKQEEIEARLNEYETLKAATERLSAEIRKTVSNLLVRGKISEGEHDCAMRRIADILEGKDE